MLSMEIPLDKLLFNVQLKEVRASTAISCYEILGGTEQRKKMEKSKSEFQYAARELRELLSYVEQQIKYMENNIGHR